MQPNPPITTTHKAWIALVFLIVTGIVSSGVIPVNSTWDKIFTVVTVIVGAFSTWAVPNQTKRDGQV